MTPTRKSVSTEITEELHSALPQTELRPVVTEIGKIVYVGDGICKIGGLPSAQMDDIVTIQTRHGEVLALILGISVELIEAVILGEYTHIRQGDTVISKGETLRIASGEKLLGRIISPIGDPLDGRGPVTSKMLRDVELVAPGVARREPVVEQLETGILVVDTIIPLGRGQRELVIGDRKSGKTRLMASLIMNQKGKGINCVYVAIGAQKAKVRALEEMLQEAGAMEYTSIVLAASDDPPSLNYLAPYVGCAIAEEFLYNGKHAIIIFDDLSRHAKAYRQMSLLLKRSPGRDAYPGDIFYLHSRLLERAVKLHRKYGAGSLTAFPMAETQNGDVSEYICTNLMSITDGHIYLDINLFHEGILPAVNSGTSVSRIGGTVQPPALRKMGELAGKQLARYNEVKSFETINTEMSEDTEREIKRGKRIMEIFAQDFRESLLNDEKTLLMYLVTSGKFDNIENAELRKLKVELIDFYRKGGYKEYKEKSVTEKEISAIEPLIHTIVEAYVASTQLEAAKHMLTEMHREEKVLPIVPDPNAETAKDAA